MALLALLAVRAEARREEIVDLLWRDVDAGKARNAFRQALHRLRTAIGEELLPQDREILRLAASDALSIDLHLFDAAAAAGRLDEAIRCYRGDFLQNVALDEPAFDQWADQERNRIRGQFRTVLEQATAAAQAEGRWADAMAHVRRLLEIAPYDEAAARLAAHVLVSAGRRLEARDMLVQFAARLNAELGLPPPTELQTLLARLERQSDKAPGAPSASSPAAHFLFAGREAELSQLLALWNATGDDSGTLALITGERGIGRTRLVQELASHAKSLRRGTALRAVEHEGSAHIPFALFADALRPLVRAAGIMGASKHLLAEASRLLPELRDSVDLPPLADVEDEAARVRFFEGVAALVDAAAYEHPILLVLEDVELIGSSSLDLLSYLAARLAGSAVMLVLTAREDGAAQANLTRVRGLIDARRASGRALAIALPPLTREATLAALGAVRAGLTDSTLSALAARSGGVPGRLPELLRRSRAGEDLGLAPVPISELLRQRLHLLSSSQRRAFLVLALFGRPVAAQLLAAAAHLTSQAAEEVVQVLEAEELIEATDASEWLASPVAAKLALDTAGQASREFLAGWIAESLAADPRTHPAELSRFFALAGQGRAAHEHARRAAFAAMRIGAWSEAVAQLKVARAFAAAPQEVADAEGMLAAFGAGHRRIGSEPRPEPVRDAGPPPASIPIRGRPASVWEQWFPNWRILLGAAVATLLISTFVMWRTPAGVASGVALTDTLVVAEGEPPRGTRFVTGDLSAGFALAPGLRPLTRQPAWADSVTRPWAEPRPDPQGRKVALTRLTGSGSDVYVVLADRSDTTALLTDRGDAVTLGWSPDGRWLLAAVTSGAPARSTLLAVRAVGPREIRQVAVSPAGVVSEAAWSPDGSRIAWVVTAGEDSQREVYVSLADGSAAQNVSRHPAEDYRIAWSGSGELLAFTSLRDGNAEIYAFGVRENLLWRLTRDPAQDDRAVFSPDGRFIAFESTRGGVAGVFVMPALGGTAQRVASGSALTLLGWRGARRYLDRLWLEVPSVPEPGDSVVISLRAVDQLGDSIDIVHAHWSLLDSGVAELRAHPDGSAETRTLVARRNGLARVVVTAGQWRSDTGVVRVGGRAIDLIPFEPDGAWRAHWTPLGVPEPTSSGRDGTGVALNADREWDSGILSLQPVPVVPGLEIEVDLSLPDAASSGSSAAVNVALVAPTAEGEIDPEAPQFLRFASVTWTAQPARLLAAVGREIQPLLPGASAARELRVGIRIEGDSTATFLIDRRPVWRSTLRVGGSPQNTTAQIWIGGRATGVTARIRAARVMLGGTVVSNP